MTTLYWAWAISAAVIVLLAIGLGFRTPFKTPLGIFIDSRDRYSLTRLQLVLWTILILSLISGVFWARLIDDGAASALDFGIPNEVLGVIGISVGSAAAATAVKASKNTLHRESVAASPNQSGTLFQIFTVEEGAGADKVIDVAKFQNFWFTVVLIVAYVALCISTFNDLKSINDLKALPGFDANFVALLGISHAGYVAAKVPNRAGTPNAATALPLADVKP